MQSVLRWLWLVTLSALLVACSTPNQTTASHKSTPGYKSARTTVPVTKGGGYYKDDGPGDRRLPADPDAIPDAVPVDEPLLTSANRPYTIQGQTYVPESNQSRYQARGKASWYGKKFHGRRTASGEAYDMYEMTAAHPTLPIPSYAKVTNVSNGKSVVVRINDRGPFQHTRLIDLSYAAAYKLGYANVGHAEVVVERVRPGDIDVDSSPVRLANITPRDDAVRVMNASLTAPMSGIADVARVPQPASADGSGVWLQLGAFGTPGNAEAFRQRMQSLASSNDVEGRLELVNRDGLYKVRIGPFVTVSRAREVAERLNVQTVVMR